jgi:hypothetical protein
MQGETRPSPLEPLSNNYCARPWGGGGEGEKRWGGSVRNFISHHLATLASMKALYRATSRTKLIGVSSSLIFAIFDV